MEMLFDVMHIMRECLTKMCLLIYTSSEIAKYIWCFSTHVGLLKILRSFSMFDFYFRQKYRQKHSCTAKHCQNVYDNLKPRTTKSNGPLSWDV